MTTFSEEFELISAIRYSNELRLARAKEQVGGIYFLIAIGMAAFCACIAPLQGWCLPTRRLQRLFPFGAKTEVGTFLHWLFLMVPYLVISGAGGLTGFIVLSALYLIAFFVMLLVAVIYRYRTLSQAQEEGPLHNHDAAVEILAGMDELTEVERNTRRGKMGVKHGSSSSSDDDEVAGAKKEKSGRSGGGVGGISPGLKKNKSPKAFLTPTDPIDGDDADMFSGVLPGSGGGGGSFAGTGHDPVRDSRNLNVTEFNIAHQPEEAPGMVADHDTTSSGGSGFRNESADSGGGLGTGRAANKRNSTPTDSAGPREKSEMEEEVEDSKEESRAAHAKKKRKTSNVLASRNTAAAAGTVGGGEGGGADEEQSSRPTSESHNAEIGSLGQTQRRTPNSVNAHPKWSKDRKKSRSQSTIGGGGASNATTTKKAEEIKTIDSTDAASTFWTSFPRVITNSQLFATLGFVIFFGLIILTLCLVIFLAPVQMYHVVSRDGLTRVPEYQPQLTAKGLVMMYAFPGIATSLRLEPYMELLTSYCGQTFVAHLATEKERQLQIWEKWIQRYSINMTLYTPSDYRNYSSVNDWFIRKIRLEYRPKPVETNVAVQILSPADCRMLIYGSVLGSTIWVKDAVVSAKALTGGLEQDYWATGSMVIARLAPQDYHRFHAPVSGTILSITELGETYWSVSADAAKSENFAFLNSRKVIVIDGGLLIGKIAYIAIGATCVGSVQLHHSDYSPLLPGDYVAAGEEIGSMQFGGSTVIMLFGRGRVVFDNRIVQRSQFPVETLVEVRSSIGVVGLGGAVSDAAAGSGSSDSNL